MSYPRSPQWQPSLPSFRVFPPQWHVKLRADVASLLPPSTASEAFFAGSHPGEFSARSRKVESFNGHPVWAVRTRRLSGGLLFRHTGNNRSWKPQKRSAPSPTASFKLLADCLPLTLPLPPPRHPLSKAELFPLASSAVIKQAARQASGLLRSLQAAIQMDQFDGEGVMGWGRRCGGQECSDESNLRLPWAPRSDDEKPFER